MSEMVERVARAIWSARYYGPFEPMPWVMDAARAAIEAMREPTEAMKAAGGDARDEIADKWDNAEAAWRAMIDAALDPKPPAGTGV